MRLDRDNFRLHMLWGIPALAIVVVLGGWYVQARIETGTWLGGASLPGLVCGVVAAAIILFEMLLWPRKWLRAWRLLPARHWMAAHLWFGMATLPLAYIHCGFHLGGMLPSLLMTLFTLTILSGLIGWMLQNVLPRIMLGQLPAETIYNQIDVVSRQNLDDLRALLVTTLGERSAESGPRPGEATSPNSSHPVSLPDADSDYRVRRPSAIVIGAVRGAGRVRGRTLRTTHLTADSRYAHRLWEVFDQVHDYILEGQRTRSPMAEPGKASAFFASLRSECGPGCADLISAFEEYCRQRRQFDLQKKLTLWLHGWLPLHIGLSVAVSILLVAHVVTALKY